MPVHDDDEDNLSPGDYFQIAADPWGNQVNKVFRDIDTANNFIQFVKETLKDATPTLWLTVVDEDGNEGKKSPVINM